MKEYLSKYHNGLEVFGIFLIIGTMGEWVMFATSFSDNKQTPELSVFFIGTLIINTTLAMFLLYQNWFCERVKNGVLTKSNIWKDPVPAFSFLYVCLSPTLMVLISNMYNLSHSITFNFLKDSGDLITLLSFSQFVIWLLWGIITRNKTRGFFMRDYKKNA